MLCQYSFYFNSFNTIVLHRPAGYTAEKMVSVAKADL